MLKKRKEILLLIFLLIAIIAGRDICQAQGTDSSLTDFHAAEQFFLQKKFPIAKKYYKTFLGNYPPQQRIDDAIYKLGEIAILENDVAIASRYFDILTQQFRGSEFADRAKLKKIFCAYRLGEFHKAMNLLNGFLSRTTDSSLKYEAYLLLGDGQSSHGEFIQAISSYLKAAMIFPEKEDAKIRIKERIEKEENPDNLLALSKSGSDIFPHGEALYRLVSIYYDKKDFSRFSQTAAGFVRQFPGHPQNKKVMKTLSDLQKNPDQFKTKIGVMLPLTGVGALQGEKMLKGIQIALSSFQSSEEIELVIKNTAGDPQTALKVAREFSEDPSVIAIIGPAFREVAKTVAPLSAEMEIPILTPSASTMDTGSHSSFFMGNSMTNLAQGREMAEFAINELNLKRFVIIHLDTHDGKELSASFKQNVLAMGGEIMAEEKYAEKDVDFSELIVKIGGMDDDDLKKEAISLAEKNQKNELSGHETDKLSFPMIKGGLWNTYDEDQYQPFLKINYDSVFIPGNDEKIGLIIPQLEFFNIVDVKLLGTNGWNTEKLAGLAKNHPEDFYFVDGFFPKSKIKMVKDFVKEYDLFFGELPDTLAAQAYDTCMTVLNVYKSGNRNRESLRKGILEMEEYHGVSGVTSFLPGANSEKKLFVLTVKKNRIVDARQGN